MAAIGQAKQKDPRGEYSPHVRIRFERNGFLIKTSDNVTDLEKILRLRHEIFRGEFINQPVTDGLDIDSYDSHGDHLMIVDKSSDAIVGTYRLIASVFSNVFYSASEFDLSTLLALEGVKLELSRACIDRAYRSGAVIHLLWRGIVEYMRAINASLLFGCSSIKTLEPNCIGEILSYLKQQTLVDSSLSIKPVEGFRFMEAHEKIFQTALKIPPLSPDATKLLLPPLFQFYLRAGAKVTELPALDRHFKCTDFFTVLRISDLKKSYGRKYLSDTGLG